MLSKKMPEQGPQPPLKRILKIFLTSLFQRSIARLSSASLRLLPSQSALAEPASAAPKAERRDGGAASAAPVNQATSSTKSSATMHKCMDPQNPAAHTFAS